MISDAKKNGSKLFQHRAKSNKTNVNKNQQKKKKPVPQKNTSFRPSSAHTKIKKDSVIKKYIDDIEARKNYISKKENFLGKDFVQMKKDHKRTVQMKSHVNYLKGKIEREAKEIIEGQQKDKEIDELNFNKEFANKLTEANKEEEQTHKKFLREMKNEKWEEHRFVKQQFKNQEEEEKRLEQETKSKEKKEVDEFLKMERENRKDESVSKAMNIEHDRKLKEQEKQKKREFDKGLIFSRKQQESILQKHKIKEKKEKWEEELKYYQSVLNPN